MELKILPGGAMIQNKMLVTKHILNTIRIFFDIINRRTFFLRKISLMKTNINEIKKKALPILKKAGITRSSIFGSYAHGEQRDDSDIDILVEVPRGTGLFAFINLRYKLEDALGKKVDLVTYKSIHRLLRDRILKEQLAILG